MPTKNAKPFVKKVEVDEKFYRIFNDDQIVDIMNDLVYKRQIKIKYSYFESGAKDWDEFYFGTPVTKSIDEIKAITLSSILYYIGDSQAVNLIDIGPGNGHPLKGWIEHLINANLLNKYISVDISDDIHRIVESNITSWYPNLGFAKYTRDIEHEELSRALIENKMDANMNVESISSVVVHFGNTICNHDDRIEVLKNMSKGMDMNDILVFSYTTDKQSNAIHHSYIKKLKSLLWIPKLLGIDVDKCEVETAFDERLQAKVKYVQLDSDYEISFSIFGGKKVVRLNKGDKIHTWRHYLISDQTLRSELDEAELEPVCIQYDRHKSIAIAICRTKDAYNQRF